MKKILVSLLLILPWLGASRLSASQLPAPTQTDTPYAVVDRGANYRVWARTNYQNGPDGQLEPQVHSYTELGTGLNYQDATGQWVDSKAEINILPNGAGACATNGQHKAIFPPDIYEGQIELNSRDGKWLPAAKA
jgi:hypothetical protein